MTKKSSMSCLRKAAAVVTTAAVTSMMVVPSALAIDGTPSSNGYGLNPSKEIGGTVPSAAAGDQIFNLNDASKTTVTGVCGGQGTASCDYLDVVGINNIGSCGYNWGTKINENPDPFAWNDILSSETTSSQVGMNIDASDSSLGIGFVKSAWSGVYTYATVDKYRPSVLCAKHSDVAQYEKIVELIHEKDGNDSYNPTIVDYSQNSGNDTSNDGLGVTTLCDILWTEAAAAKAVDGYGTTVTCRYGDPEVIAQNFEAFVKASQWYILSKVEGTDKMKTVAVVNSYADGTVTAAASDPAEDRDGYVDSTFRLCEALEQTTNNIARTGSTFTAGSTDKGVTTYTTTSLSDFKNVDVVFYNSKTGMEDFQAALTASGSDAKVVSVSLAITNQGFGLSRNLVECLGYVYPEYYKLSYALKYYYTNFAHVKEEYVDAVMNDLDANKILPTGNAAVDLDTTGYTESYMTEIFAAGEEYYLANYKNANSNCSNWRLQAQGTVAANNYQFGTYSTSTAKAKQTITCKNASKTIKLASGVKATKKKQTFKIGASAKGSAKITYSVTSAVKKAGVTVSSAGKVTIAKGTKKGTYKITVKAAATSKYKAATKTVKVVIK